MKYQKIALNVCLGMLTCLFLIVSPSFSINSVQKISAPNITQHQKEAEKEINRNLIAQSSSELKRFVAIMSGDEIVPSAVSTPAIGVVGAVLKDNRLVIRGSFSNLSSPLRDYATDPLSPPNPNITSGVHIHRGAPSANGPFQYALSVEPSKDGLGGSLKGEYMLNEEQLKALNSSGLYVDLHTKSNRAGELRGILKAAS